MTGFIKIPFLDNVRPTVINIANIDTFFLDISGGNKRILFKLKERTVEAVFNTREQAEEFYDKICNYLLIEL